MIQVARVLAYTLVSLAVDRQTAIIAAFGVLIGAGVILSAVAWILLGKELRRGRATKVDGDDQAADEEFEATEQEPAPAEEQPLPVPDSIEAAAPEQHQA